VTREPLALVAAPTGVPGSQGGHTGPLGLGQPAVRGQPLGAEHVGVGCRGTEEGLPVGTQLSPEQPLGQLLGVGPGLGAGRVVEVTEPFQDAAQVAVGVVDPAQRLLDGLDGVLGELHHRLGVTVVQERLDPGDHLLDVVGVGQGRAVILVVVGFHGTVDGGSEGGQIHIARPAAHRLQQQTITQPRVGGRLRHQQLDQRVLALASQMGADVLHRAPRPTPPGGPRRHYSPLRAHSRRQARSPAGTSASCGRSAAGR
jgi:hypothetical protein